MPLPSSPSVGQYEKAKRLAATEEEVRRIELTEDVIARSSRRSEFAADAESGRVSAPDTITERSIPIRSPASSRLADDTADTADAADAAEQTSVPAEGVPLATSEGEARGSEGANEREHTRARMVSLDLDALAQAPPQPPPWAPELGRRPTSGLSGSTCRDTLCRDVSGRDASHRDPSHRDPSRRDTSGRSTSSRSPAVEAAEAQATEDSAPGSTLACNSAPSVAPHSSLGTASSLSDGSRRSPRFTWSSSRRADESASSRIPEGGGFWSGRFEAATSSGRLDAKALAEAAEAAAEDSRQRSRQRSRLRSRDDASSARLSPREAAAAATPADAGSCSSPASERAAAPTAFNTALMAYDWAAAAALASTDGERAALEASQARVRTLESCLGEGRFEQALALAATEEEQGRVERMQAWVAHPISSAVVRRVKLTQPFALLDAAGARRLSSQLLPAEQSVTDTAEWRLCWVSDPEGGGGRVRVRVRGTFADAIRAYNWVAAEALAASEAERDDLATSKARVSWLEEYVNREDFERASGLAITAEEVRRIAGRRAWLADDAAPLASPASAAAAPAAAAAAALDTTSTAPSAAAAPAAASPPSAASSSPEQREIFACGNRSAQLAALKRSGSAASLGPASLEAWVSDPEGGGGRVRVRVRGTFADAIRAYNWVAAEALAASEAERDDLATSKARVSWLEEYVNRREYEQARGLAITEEEVRRIGTYATQFPDRAELEARELLAIDDELSSQRAACVTEAADSLWRPSAAWGGALGGTLGGASRAEAEACKAAARAACAGASQPASALDPTISSPSHPARWRFSLGGWTTGGWTEASRDSQAEKRESRFSVVETTRASISSLLSGTTRLSLVPYEVRHRQRERLLSGHMAECLPRARDHHWLPSGFPSRDFTANAPPLPR